MLVRLQLLLLLLLLASRVQIVPLHLGLVWGQRLAAKQRLLIRLLILTPGLLNGIVSCAWPDEACLLWAVVLQLSSIKAMPLQPV